MFGRVAGPCPVLTGCAEIADAVATRDIMACPGGARVTDPPFFLTRSRFIAWMRHDMSHVEHGTRVCPT